MGATCRNSGASSGPSGSGESWFTYRGLRRTSGRSGYLLVGCESACERRSSSPLAAGPPAGYISLSHDKPSCLTDLRTQLQTALAAAYTLERELGRGGMATVFLAQDLRHDPPRAPKALHPALARTR